MKIKIETTDNSIVDTFKQNPLTGVSIEVEYPIIEFVEGNIPVYKIFLEYVIPIASSVLANWIYDKLKNAKSNSTIINDTKIVINKIEIENVIMKVTPTKEIKPTNKKR